MPSDGPRIVILGGGFAGAYCAQALESTLRRAHAHVTLINRQNYFVFTPLLVEAGTGALEPRHAVVSIRSFLRSARFLMADAIAADTAARTVTYRLPETGQTDTIPYDHLVIALGAVTRLPPVPGLAEHGMDLKDLPDAVAMRDHAIEMLEVADSVTDPATRNALLGFVVVGGNFTGVEVAGEFQAFLSGAAKRYRTIRPRDIRLTLVDMAPRILGALDEDLADYAARAMRRRGIDIRLNDSVTRIEPDHVLLKSGQTVPARTVFWCAGIAPNPLVASLGLPTDPRGYILCEPDARVRGHTNVWAIGDCAVNMGPDGKPYPATAQHAVREAKHLARNLARAIAGRPTLPTNIVNQGSLAALGCRSGVARIGPFKFSGFAAWWLWRTVYLLKTPGWGRRLRVALDWTLDLLFRRDYVQLGVHQRPQPAAAPPATRA